jgi:dTDP-4-amino-4,6-dideoxygalactose transaminase
VIPISVVDLGAEAEQQVLEVLRSGIIAQGPKVAALEAGFADLVGVQHAVAVNNGTTALVAALQVLDLRPGDEVITSPFTFVATLNAILEAGATARFADISADDFCLDAASVGSVLNEFTRVLLPVHLYGQSANMGKLAPLAEEHGLHLVEDAAQAHGATYEGRGAGSWGLGCFSFYATKNLTTGEGGMITTNDAELADQLRVMRNQGMRQRYVYEMAGHNYRMTDLQAALALPALAGYGAQVRRRRANAARLSERLGGSPGLRVPSELPGREHVWHQYTVLVTDEAPVSRDELAQRLTERSVGSGVYYPRTVYDYECYADHPRVMVSATPVATEVASRCLSLPVHARLTDEQVDMVADAVLEVMGR